MSEKENNDAVIVEDEMLTSEASTVQSEKPPSPKSSKLALVIAILSFILTVAVIFAAVHFYKENKQLTDQQQMSITQLNGQLSKQKSALAKQSQQDSAAQASLKSQVKQVNQQLQKVENTSKLYLTDMQALQRAFAETQVRHPNDWVLAEIEYLVRLAGRKIWLEKDIPSAIALLLAADQRVVELSDASLSVLRKAFLEDINTLEALPKRDQDGMVLALAALERRVDKLMIVGLTGHEETTKADAKLSSDVNDWQKNLTVSWTNFLESFIVINKRDTQIEALLSPDQRWYLKENMRNDLAKAELAVYREHQKVYEQSLAHAKNLLNTYYDLEDANTAQFYQAIEKLGKRQIAITYPDQLKSAPLLDRIIEQRVKKSLASSRVEQE